jgi:pterin-4a-carbinolamine dehydratase
VRYRVVALRTTTHDAGGLTQRDLDLLVAITALATASGATPIVAS